MKLIKDYTWKPDWAPVLVEGEIHPHSEEEKANLFESADSGSTEYEVLNWIHASIRALKPELVLETGAYEGLGTICLSHACKLNGFGKVHSLEMLPGACVRTQSLLEEQHLNAWGEIHQYNSLDYIRSSNLIFDIGFFDSETDIRVEECETMLKKGTLKKLAVFHDTAPLRSLTAPHFTPPEVQDRYRKGIFRLAKEYPQVTGYYDSPLSRGFIALFLNG